MRVALIGAVGHQHYALRGIEEDPEASLAALANTPDGKDVAAYIDTMEAKPPVFEDYRRMLDEAKPDVVSVSPMYCDHQPVAKECLGRGIHVFCEKPVAFDLEGLGELKAAWKESGCHFAAMHAYRCAPNFIAGYDALKAGAIGRPVLVTSQKSYPFNRNHPGPCNRPEFYRERVKYGSTLAWVAIHAIDWTYWMVGGFLDVYAAHTTECNFGYGECESSGVIAFRLARGGQGAINFDFLKGAKDPVPQDRCRIAGEGGVIEIHSGKAELATHAEAPRELDLPEPENLFAGFLRQIRGEGACRLSAEDTFEVTRLALIARQSADAGGLLRVGDFPIPG
jgi:predicted dehydrogenase